MYRSGLFSWKEQVIDNPERGEVGFKGPEGKTLTLKFSNAGKRVVETELDLESSQIMHKLNTRAIGDRMTTALLLGATRKYHARQFPSLAAVDDYLDEISDAEDFGKLQVELTAALLSAYLRVPKKTILVGYFGKEDPDAEEAEDGEEDAPKGSAATPAKRTRKTKTEE